MKVHNFRIGFATNSSSSHSVVLIPPEMASRDLSSLSISPDWGDYGWSHFRLVTEEEKLRYLLAQFFSGYGNTKMAVERLSKEYPHFGDIDPDKPGYEQELSVDHQSAWGMEGHDEDSLETMIRFFKSPRVVILGGNDNTDERPNEIPGAKEVDFVGAFEGADGNGSHRMKDDGDYMIAYDAQQGTKVRFSLKPDAPDYVKASVPELVDLKITNYCSGGCEFCYQASTIKGRHAFLDVIKRHVDLLAKAKVFEIALGGGEPTDHPHIAEILAYIASKNITPNITTFSDRWLADNTIVDAVLDHVGGVGVSVHGADLSLVKKIKVALRDRWSERKRGRRVRVTAQHVIGSVPISTTVEFLENAFKEREPILLLGFKEVGFGKTFARTDHETIAMHLRMALVGKATAPVSVDTALVDQYPDLMAALGVPNALVSSPEGKFSCYIDSVMGKIGPSSYVEPKTMTSVPETLDEFKAVFATY